ncbi:MAG: hypothetical protein IH997_03425 [Proteobacteria bacterium]|nr:hypothetical protein [Pseudomonadota bacterium]
MPLLLLGGIAAFSAYFAMYAFRKPLTVATYDDVGFMPLGLDYKSALVIMQVIGYALSKLIGIRVIAGFGRKGRARAIAGLIGVSWAALVAFALVSPALGLVCVFFNGLPLGMIWGLVFSYVEGRRVSELLGAMLCASFIVSSGLVKSAGALLLQAGVSERWMPALTGLPFMPLLLLSLWMLERLPPPSAQDEAERAPRAPMGRTDRAAFLRDHGLPLALLVGGYVLLTAMRDFRDNFAPELWNALGMGGSAAVFSQSEVPVAVIALSGLAALMLVRDNLRALLAMHALILLGGLMLGLGTLAFQAGWLAPMPWMIVTGAGLYLAYTPFNAMLFDRMIAVVGRAGNAGFLIYVADASGYAGSVALLVWRSLFAPGRNWLPVFIDCAYLASALVVAFTLCSALVFMARRTEKGHD